MRHSLYLISFLVSLYAWAGENPKSEFPMHPDLTMTPGTLCQHADEFRYPEKIAYCNRNVTNETKHEVIVEYEKKYGYDIESHRADFKIDHFIPLCMGGSNEPTNLWPQNKVVYEITDPFEPELCGKIASGEMKQADAVAEIIKRKMAVE